MPASRWNADELSRLRDLAAEGLSASDIAEDLGRTRASVWTALSRQRLSLRCEPRSVRERVLALVHEGWSFNRIARQHGVEVVAIQRLVATTSRQSATAPRIVDEVAA